MPIRQVAGDRYDEAWALTNLGAALSHLGRREEAEALSTALESYGRFGDTLLTAHTLWNPALCARSQGDTDTARAHRTRAADACTRVGADAHAACARAIARGRSGRFARRPGYKPVDLHVRFMVWRCGQWSCNVVPATAAGGGHGGA